jgi:hypothetical protein
MAAQKSVYVAGSRKFFDEITGLVATLKKSGIEASNAGKWDKARKDTPESEKTALLRAFREIGGKDVTYVYAPRGYVGKTVAMEIAYAYSRKKEIASSEKLEELSARALVSRVMGPGRLAEYCRR